MNMVSGVEKYEKTEIIFSKYSKRVFSYAYVSFITFFSRCLQCLHKLFRKWCRSNTTYYFPSVILKFLFYDFLSLPHPAHLSQKTYRFMLCNSRKLTLWSPFFPLFCSSIFHFSKTSFITKKKKKWYQNISLHDIFVIFLHSWSIFHSVVQIWSWIFVEIWK